MLRGEYQCFLCDLATSAQMAAPNRVYATSLRYAYIIPQIKTFRRGDRDSRFNSHVLTIVKKLFRSVAILLCCLVVTQPAQRNLVRQETREPSFKKQF